MLEKIKQEILEAVDCKIDPSILEKVKKELDTFAKTDGLNNKNNLENFYVIWKKFQGQQGNKNELNSWTAYALRLTSQKPSEDKLATHRVFARAGFPDIDSDFDYMRQHEVYEYVIEKYGRDNVGNISTYNGLKLKSSIRRLGKVFDIANAFHKGQQAYVTENEEKVDELVNLLPRQMGAILKTIAPDGKEVAIKTIQDAYQYCPTFKQAIDKHPDILKCSKDIEGINIISGCLAANTPILTSKGWVRIDQIDSSKFKIAYINSEGKKKYTNKFRKFKTGSKKLYRLKLVNGYFVDITDEHLVFTDQGCVKFEDIGRDIKKYKILSLEEGL